jgi:hypothetical protein
MNFFGVFGVFGVAPKFWSKKKYYFFLEYILEYLEYLE